MGTGSGAGAPADLVLKAACERCGASSSNLYGTSCRHTTLCADCGRAMARASGRCPVCAAPVTRLIREFEVRVDTSTDKACSIGRFATGLPPFSKTRSVGNRWTLRNEAPQGRQLTGNMRKNNSRRTWVLEDETGEHQYQGQTENPPATYYSLTWKGKEMTAVPVGSWCNFSKIAQYKQLTLEEAEEKMNRRRSSASGYERWLMKAATNGAAAFSSDVKTLDVYGGAKNEVHPKKEDRNENGNQSDKGEEDEERGAARKNMLGLTMKDMDEDDEDGGKDRDFDLDDEIEKGDHWEHEETFTDDDEAVDVDTEEKTDSADPEAAPPEIKQDDNENELGSHSNLSKSGQELKKLLRRAAGENESDIAGKNTDEEEPPSPEPAPKQLVEAKSEPVDNYPAKPTPSVHAQTPTPASNSIQKRTSGGGDANTSNSAASKKIKTEPESRTLVVKDESLSSLQPISKSSPSARTRETSPVTEEEIRTVFCANGSITTQDLVSRFKTRLVTQEDKNEFGQIVKKLTRVFMNKGYKCMVLRKEYK